MPRIGDTLGPFVLDESLGSGSFGAVFKAHYQTGLKVPVALKIPLVGYSEPQAFLAEAETWLRASGHPNIVPVLQADVYDDGPVIVSEYVSGGTLRKRIGLRTGVGIPWEEALSVLDGMLAGLDHLHGVGIVHRDLKPENVLMQADIPRLTDFGVARLVTKGEKTRNPYGTVAYMPPEAFLGQVDSGTDLWAAAVILYEMLTGTLPFDAANEFLLMTAIKSGTPAPLPETVPDHLRAFIERAMSPDAAQRFKTAKQMRAELGEVEHRLREKQRKVEDFRVQVSVSAEEARSGASREVALPGRTEVVSLPAGILDGQSIRMAGLGLQSDSGRLSGDLVLQISVAPEAVCGEDVPAIVSLTWDEGLQGQRRELVLDGRRIQFDVPPGARTGSTLRVPGEGRPGRNGGPHGDLVITFQVAPQPIRGRDLEYVLTISDGAARTGTVRRFLAHGKPEEVRIHPGARHGQLIRIPGRGESGQDGGPPGDLLVTLDVEMPPEMPPAPQPAPARRPGWLYPAVGGGAFAIVALVIGLVASRPSGGGSGPTPPSGNSGGAPTGGSAQTPPKPDKPPEATSGQPYTFEIPRSGTVDNWEWDAAKAPPGLTLSPAGVIEGKPARTGSFTFSATAISAGNRTPTELKILVKPVPEAATRVAEARTKLRQYDEETSRPDASTRFGTRGDAWKEMLRDARRNAQAAQDLDPGYPEAPELVAAALYRLEDPGWKQVNRRAAKRFKGDTRFDVQLKSYQP